ncbi:haloacid dehalogenase type II [Pseudonocardia spinosispora]|uniref:haloacid dehalogenase type II n=1 Tax=Pseudonocardia spinosispora TaxID=103441 RepID=UPI0003F59BC9|nr:haloacid dehalogenase type II [Pseudonocardia spinosispora]
MKVLAFDIFGTTVDWRTGVAEQVADIAVRHGVELDAGRFTDEWRDRYLPSMGRVNRGERDWAYLDTLHRETLDELLVARNLDGLFDEETRWELVRTWHRLPAWPDAVEGLTRIRARYPVAALSNGGFALMTGLIKAAGLPFDCILSAELAKAYKPDPRPYRTTAALLDVPPEEVLMVACHNWDLDGAQAAGLRTAFVERPREKGPHRTADRSTPGRDHSVASFTDLATILDC